MFSHVVGRSKALSHLQTIYTNRSLQQLSSTPPPPSSRVSSASIYLFNRVGPISAAALSTHPATFFLLFVKRSTRVIKDDEDEEGVEEKEEEEEEEEEEEVEEEAKKCRTRSSAPAPFTVRGCALGQKGATQNPRQQDAPSAPTPLRWRKTSLYCRSGEKKRKKRSCCSCRIFFLRVNISSETPTTRRPATPVAENTYRWNSSSDFSKKKKRTKQNRRLVSSLIGGTQRGPTGRRWRLLRRVPPN